MPTEPLALIDNPATREAIAVVFERTNEGSEELQWSDVKDALPFYAVILLLAVVTGLYSTVLQSRPMDTEKLREYKERMERLKERKEAAEERGDEEALE